MKKLSIIADENIPSVHPFFECFGEIQTYPGRNLSAEQVKDADILLIRSVTKVNESLLKGSNVKFVGTCTIGMDHLDTKYLKQNNISYANAPGCNANGVVQYDLAALAAIDELWQKKKIGIIGCGNVGGRLFKALQNLGCECLVYDPFLSDEQCSKLTTLNDVLDCDIICMHAPYTTQGPFPTHQMIDRAALERMRSGAILLNAGRGGAIDNQALLKHLKGGADLRVILDVWENEPVINVELMNYVKVATSHIAGYGYEGKLNGSAMIFSSLLAFLIKHSILPLDWSKKDCEQYCFDLLKKLKGPPEGVCADSVNSAIAATYNVMSDDARFRETILKAQSNTLGESENNVAIAFDQLRKTYPVRRELDHYSLKTEDPELKQISVSVGFFSGDK